MRWITQDHPKVDRVACPWLIRKFIDPEAEFLFVPAQEVFQVAARQKATIYGVPGVELGHEEGKTSFEALVAKYGIEDPAIHLLAQIVHGAGVTHDLFERPEAPGLKAIAEGFRHLKLSDDYEILFQEFFVYDALYAYCQRKLTEERSSRE